MVEVKKIISGGQIGADIAGLRAAKILDIETGGWMPKGFKTLDGNKPEYAKMYGMIELVTDDYPPRTRMNVVNSDGTVRFATNFNTYGEKATLREVHKANKPYFDIQPYNSIYQPPFLDFVKWIEENNVQVLNVAGNADYEIEVFVESYLVKALMR